MVKESKWEKERAVMSQKMQQLNEMIKDMGHREDVLRHNRESLTKLIVDMKVVNDIRDERNKSITRSRLVSRKLYFC